MVHSAELGYAQLCDDEAGALCAEDSGQRKRTELGPHEILMPHEAFQLTCIPQ